MKILILKLGYSETLDPEMGKVVSLGDVVRCTVVLEALRDKYKDAQITWLISQEAFPLISDNPYIDRILIWDEFVPFALMREQFDMVVNLEKIHGICALADMIQGWEKVGFRFDITTGGYSAYEKSLSATSYIEQKANGEVNHKIWQQVLVEMVGCTWNNQEYSLGYKPTPIERVNVGLNYQVGSKWPTKAMNMDKWRELEVMLNRSNISYSYQQGMTNLYEYMDWISGCDVLVSHDSLGVHLALAMKKSVVVLFGSTSGEEIFYYGRGVSIYPKLDRLKYECIPCYSPICNKDEHCMNFIELDKLVHYIKFFLNKGN